MANEVPQYANISLIFDDIVDSTGLEMDLSDVDNYILSVARYTPRSSPILILDQEVTPAKFVVDADANEITVSFSSTDLSDVPGKYYVNLWLIEGDTKITHLTKNFDLVPSVKYS